MDEFLQRMGQLFECVLFTASLAKVLTPRPDQVLNQVTDPEPDSEIMEQITDPKSDTEN